LRSERLKTKPVLFSCGSTKLPGVEEGIDFAIRKALKTFLVSKR
jgi:hypothetical protein